MNGTTIYHVYYDDRHFYFGSIAAIFECFTPDDLGVSKSRLWSFGITEVTPYRNNKCTIYRGTIIRKRTNRKRP